MYIWRLQRRCSLIYTKMDKAGIHLTPFTNFVLQMDHTCVRFVSSVSTLCLRTKNWILCKFVLVKVRWVWANIVRPVCKISERLQFVIYCVFFHFLVFIHFLRFQNLEIWTKLIYFRDFCWRCWHDENQPSTR